MPSAIDKAAYMRVVPETYRRAMETQVHVDKVEPHNLEDKVLAFHQRQHIRHGTNGYWKHCTGTLHRQFKSECHVKFKRLFGQLSRSEQLMSTHHNGDKIGTLAMPTHQEVQMACCTVCRKAKGRAKVEVSTASAATVESQVIRPSAVMQKVEKQKERERRETARFGQLERDGQKVKVGALQVKAGSNRDQQE